ncbi:hypothetical protein, partial [Limnospira sp. PMC 1243.20]|uniref:hypothetical protein n=1 Tax=Limnospira sp. PMC 1243.20 TaxID=2981041 RepID=UPI0028E0FE4A
SGDGNGAIALHFGVSVQPYQFPTRGRKRRDRPPFWRQCPTRPIPHQGMETRDKTEWSKKRQW